jgi:ASC-1-like (ASCH) protein
MSTLHLSLKGEYFDAIKDGSKAKEYRLTTDYWRKRLVGREYSQIVLTKGIPGA